MVKSTKSCTEEQHRTAIEPKEKHVKITLMKAKNSQELGFRKFEGDFPLSDTVSQKVTSA